MDLTDKLLNQQDNFRTHSIQYKTRRDALKKLKESILFYESDLLNALKKDLRKPEFEALGSEIVPLYKEIDFMIAKLSKLMRPLRVSTPLVIFPGRAYRKPEPYGKVLIISPWNYPVALSLVPLIGAIAAGNTVVLKPSEISVESTVVIEKIISRSFNNSHATVVKGGVEETTELLTKNFDKIFFTGGETVGKIVMKAAAENLTPVTLELGGKSPCIVDNNVNMGVAARRIAWGKCFNAGQTCIAPDYILLKRSSKDKFIEEFTKSVSEFYPKGAFKTDDYSGIINPNHFNRIVSYMNDGKILSGGKFDKEKLVIEPTLLEPDSVDVSVMKNEIFGPLLPLILFDKIEEAIEFVNRRPKPLALYVFSKSKKIIRRVVNETSSGGVTVNDTLAHYQNSSLPFGGVGTSGIGAYHGKESFKLFSHYKSVQYRGWFDIKLKYPPYKLSASKIKKLLKLLS